MQVIATDGVNNDTATIWITILDINDNTPFFKNSTNYATTVQEVSKTLTDI